MFDPRGDVVTNLFSKEGDMIVSLFVPEMPLVFLVIFSPSITFGIRWHLDISIPP